MFRWLRRLFHRRTGPPFSTEGRNIFTYWNGLAWRYADPIQLDRKLIELAGEKWAERFSVIRMSRMVPAAAGDKLRDKIAADARAAAKGLAELAQKVFHLVPLDFATGNGLSEGECLTVLGQYMTFVVDLMESYDVSPSSSLRVQSEPSPASSPGESSVGSTSPDTVSAESEPASLPEGSSPPSPEQFPRLLSLE